MRREHRPIVFLVVAVLMFFTAMVIVTVSVSDSTPIAAEANRLCQGHQGVSQDGISSDYVICRDGYVAAR